MFIVLETTSEKIKFCFLSDRVEIVEKSKHVVQPQYYVYVQLFTPFSMSSAIVVSSVINVILSVRHGTHREPLSTGQRHRNNSTSLTTCTTGVVTVISVCNNVRASQRFFVVKSGCLGLNHFFDHLTSHPARRGHFAGSNRHSGR